MIDSLPEVPRITPFVQAMVICDHLWRDPLTGKHTLFGTFSCIAGNDFPLVHPEMGIYIALTDGSGSIRIRLRLVDVDEAEEPCFEVEANCPFSDPRAIGELGLTVPNVAFDHPGEYRLQLFADDEFLMERRLLVSDSQVDEIESE